MSKILKAKYCKRCKQLYDIRQVPGGICPQCGQELQTAIAEVNNFYIAQDAEIISSEPIKK